MLTPFLLSFPPLPALAPYSLSKQERFKDILSLTLDNTTAATLMRKPRLLVAAGVVYTACRLAHCGRTIEEVSAACAHRVDSKALRRLQADMCRALGLPSGSVAAEELVARIGSQCKQPSPLMERARRACQLISSYNLAASLAPQLVAAVGVVLLTMVGNRKISLRLVAKATLGCNTAQIRRAYSSLYPYFDLLLPGEIRGDFDLALLPRELVTVPSLTGKSHRKELSAAEPSSSSASSSSSSSSSSSEPPAAQESDGSVIKAIDETKPRTRSNSLVEEDWEVVRPLIATRKKTKGKTKAKKRKVGESADAEADAKAEAEVEAETEEAPPAGPGKAPQEGESKRKARRLGRDGTDKEVAASTAPKSASAPRPMSGSAPVSKGSAPECQERGRSPASVASASNETSSAGGPVAVAGSIPSSTNATATASATAYLHAHGAKRGTSKASRQAALDAVSSKHGSPLFLTRSR